MKIGQWSFLATIRTCAEVLMDTHEISDRHGVGQGGLIRKEVYGISQTKVFRSTKHAPYTQALSLICLL
jgi:hypothetical protein